ncbi:response regulator transcription factor [Streptomyces xanthophaeus]|uniref:DNA-binding response regulator n=1 Tax=Streptomyces xanthophaeus TaxID=67385 RepID=A0A919LDM1_9ACTN|nr:response regulator transcription factor [Streptomyces xanthophaeus]WCD84583.1 Virulence factors putative positive transcription regulator BvgA [Streptomyces xanthophaeus]WST20820.1 response regulator transcription factor [Streptomyces xanthophaeus]WST64194.1 response regulator transcription factor [Streptomyces xanthophaeus]GHI83552.1 DNA-binding response regulator [Streptomyces xanthophaeus]
MSGYEPTGTQDAAEPVRLAAVDDHPVVRWGLRSCLAELAPDIEWVGLEVDVTSLLAAVTSVPSVVLLDIELGDGSQVEDNVTRLREAGSRVLLFTREHRPVVVRRGIEAGALGLVLKEDPETELLEAVRAAHAGDSYVSGRLAHQIVNDPRGLVRLSEKQLAVLKLLARGMKVPQIAGRLYMSTGTVNTHRKRAIHAFSRQDGHQLTDNNELVWRSVVDGHIEVAPDPRPDR